MENWSCLAKKQGCDWAGAVMPNHHNLKKTIIKGLNGKSRQSRNQLAGEGVFKNSAELVAWNALDE